MNEIMNISGVDCYYKDGTAFLKLETVARGLGFTTVAKSGNEIVRWARVGHYLEELGFPQNWRYGVDAFGEPVYIPENIFYRLAMKAKSESAERFQALIADEIIPSIRKTGSYAAQPQAPALSPAQLIAAQAQILVDMEQKMAVLQSQTAAVQDQCSALSQKVDTAVKAFSRPSEDHWKSDIDNAIKELCEERHLSVFATKGRMYRDLEQKINCDVTSRLTRLRNRKRKAGARRQDAMALTKLDAIAADKQLRAAFELIVKEWQARSIVLEGQKEIVEQAEFDLVE